MILAGVLKPNLGKEEEPDYDALIDYFKGTEAQLFFEKVRDGEIRIGYKPQQVDEIPKIFCGLGGFTGGFDVTAGALDGLQGFGCSFRANGLCQLLGFGGFGRALACGALTGLKDL